MMVCVDSNLRTPTDTFCSSVVLVHERQFTLGSALSSGLHLQPSLAVTSLEAFLAAALVDGPEFYPPDASTRVWTSWHTPLKTRLGSRRLTWNE